VSGGPSPLERPAPETVRRIALGYLAAASAASDRLAAGEAGSGADPAALHDFRVAIRRLRSTLRAYRPVLGDAIRRRDERALRALTRATGAGRDAEVGRDWLVAERAQLDGGAREVADRLIADLEADTRAGYESARAAVNADFRGLEKRLRRRLRCLARLGTSADGDGPGTVRSFAGAFDRILPAFAGALDEALDAVGSVRDRREAHRARIRGKRVRYLLEPLVDEVPGAAELVDRLEGLQDAVGDLRDLHLLEERAASRVDEAGAASLLARIRAGQADRFAELEAAWLGEDRAAFFEALEEVRRRVASAAPDALEIERKYLLSGRPEGLEEARARDLEQGYLPGSRIQERLRRIRDGSAVRHVRSIKLGRGLVRTEVQEEIEPGLFERLWPLTEGRRVTKRRYRAHGGGLLWEIDGFTDRELWLAEVELPSAGFEPELPGWLTPYVVREVTDEPEYLNVNLAR